MVTNGFSVADSGGTSTRWAFCGEDGSIEWIETPGMHPKYVLDWTPAQLDELSRHLPPDRSAPLYFYGAGCGNPQSVIYIKHLLGQLGFRQIEVQPDTLAACRACCGTEPGTVAILGTGSILLDYDGNRIVKRIGGFGSLVGDEGSGFFFGKLLVKAFLEETLQDQTVPAVKALLGSRQDVLFQLASPSAQQWLSGLAGVLSGTPLEDIHRDNLRAFAISHLPQLLNSRTLHVTGSYGWFQREILQEILSEYGWEAGNTLQSPLEKLVDYHQSIS